MRGLVHLPFGSSPSVRELGLLRCPPPRLLGSLKLTDQEQAWTGPLRGTSKVLGRVVEYGNTGRLESPRMATAPDVACSWCERLRKRVQGPAPPARDANLVPDADDLGRNVCFHTTEDVRFGLADRSFRGWGRGLGCGQGLRAKYRKKGRQEEGG